MITSWHILMRYCMTGSFVAVIAILRFDSGKAESLFPHLSLLVCYNGNKTLTQFWHMHEHLLTHWPQSMCFLALAIQWTAHCLYFRTFPQHAARKTHGIQWYFHATILLAFFLWFRNGLGAPPRAYIAGALVPMVTLLGDGRTCNRWSLVKG